MANIIEITDFNDPALDVLCPVDAKHSCVLAGNRRKEYLLRKVPK